MRARMEGSLPRVSSSLAGIALLLRKFRVGLLTSLLLPSTPAIKINLTDTVINDFVTIHSALIFAVSFCILCKSVSEVTLLFPQGATFAA